MKQVNVCRGFSLFMLRAVILPSVIIIVLTVHSHYRYVVLSAKSDQETASLPIDKSADKCEIGRFVLTIKTENSRTPRR